MQLSTCIAHDRHHGHDRRDRELACGARDPELPCRSTDPELPCRSTDPELPCRSTDPELFFAESPVDVESAKAVCAQCPVRVVCLAGALERREPWGVWGGELFVSGVIVARKRPRGRPRKDEVAA